MKTIAIVGMTGTGKTTDVKNILNKTSKAKKLIYDVNQEYEEYHTQPELPLESDFKKQVLESKNVLVVFEEATIFFNNKGHDEQLERLLVRKRHINVMIVMCFHSLIDVPDYVRRKIDIMILHKVQDNEKAVERKYSSQQQIINAFYEVNRHESRFYSKTIKLM